LGHVVLSTDVIELMGVIFAMFQNMLLAIREDQK
jgi:hypothetical protein